MYFVLVPVLVLDVSVLYVLDELYLTPNPGFVHTDIRSGKDGCKGRRGAVTCLLYSAYIQYILLAFVSPCSLQLLFSYTIIFKGCLLKLEIGRNNYPGIL